jgi:hypothetical protein
MIYVVQPALLDSLMSKELSNDMIKSLFPTSRTEEPTKVMNFTERT